MAPKGKRANRSEAAEEVEVEENFAADLLEQKRLFTALVNQLSDSFKGFVQIIMDTNNRRFDEMTREIQEIKSSLQFTQREVDAIKVNMDEQSTQIKATRDGLYEACDFLKVMSDKVEYLEAQTKRKNLIFAGIQEAAGETWKDAESKVREVLKNKLDIQQDIAMERAHRVGKATDRPRAVMVRLKNEKDKTLILQQAKKLKGSNIYINEDYTKAVRERRKELMPKLREARQKGDIAFLRYDRLVTRPQNQDPEPKSSTPKTSVLGQGPSAAWERVDLKDMMV